MLKEAPRPNPSVTEVARTPEIILDMSHALGSPGQGNQEVGMGMLLAQHSPAAANRWEMANHVLYPDLGYNFTDLVWHGTLEELTKTENAQPAIIADSLARLATLQETGQYDNPGWHVGNSLGFITALVTAGSLSVEGAVQLSKARGEAFKQAIDPNDKTTMMACSKLNPAVLDELLEKFSLVKTLVNTDTQVVVGGRIANVTRAAEYFVQLDETKKESGRVIPLDVDAAFHSHFMEPAVPVYAKALEGIEIVSPTNGTLVGGSTVRELITPNDIRAELIAQLTHTERWNEVVKYLFNKGVVLMTELNESPRLLLMVRELAGGGARPKKIATPGISPEDKGIPIAQRLQLAT